MAVLALNANRAVPADELVEALWEDPPRTARTVLYGLVSRLRTSLDTGLGGAGERLLSSSAGYQLRLNPGELDLERFLGLVERGRAARAADRLQEAMRTLGEALALWRGPPLADLGGEPFARKEVGWMEALRSVSIEEEIELELALGRHSLIVGKLAGLTRQHPFREGLHRSLMLALYRSGRQAEALAAFSAARRMLVDEFGLEPSVELRRMQEAILAQDPGLELSGTRKASETALALPIAVSTDDPTAVVSVAARVPPRAGARARSHERTLRAVVNLYGDLCEQATVDQVRRVAVAALPELVGADGAYWSGLRVTEGPVPVTLPVILQHQEWATLIKVRAEQVLVHPIVEHWSRNPDRPLKALSMSDVISRKAFRRTALYSDGYQPLGVDGGVWVPTVWNRTGSVGYAIWDRCWDWQPTDLKMLDLMAGMLIRAERLVGQRADAHTSLQAIDRTLEMHGRATAIIDPRGRVTHATPAANRWMNHLRSGGRAGELPNALDQWLQARRTGQPAAGAMSIDTPDGPVRVAHYADRGQGVDVLEFALKTDPFPADRLHKFGLTNREIDVLALLAQGLSDAAIGVELGIGRRTVSKHLENIYRRLGVTSRHGAVATLAREPADDTTAGREA